MNITNIKIEGLFGLFHHEIPLNQKDRITIIHGPNGFGKTALLRMIDGLFNGRLSVFFAIPFASFVVGLSDGNNLQIIPHAGMNGT